MPHEVRAEEASVGEPLFGGVDPAIALDALLSRIERRKFAGNGKLVNEYDRLLRGWAKQLSRISGTKLAITRK
jgi:hypothetical protein